MPRFAPCKPAEQVRLERAVPLRSKVDPDPGRHGHSRNARWKRRHARRNSSERPGSHLHRLVSPGQSASNEFGPLALPDRIFVSSHARPGIPEIPALWAISYQRGRFSRCYKIPLAKQTKSLLTTDRLSRSALCLELVDVPPSQPGLDEYRLDPQTSNPSSKAGPGTLLLPGNMHRDRARCASVRNIEWSWERVGNHFSASEG